LIVNFAHTHIIGPECMLFFSKGPSI